LIQEQSLGIKRSKSLESVEEFRKSRELRNKERRKVRQLKRTQSEPPPDTPGLTKYNKKKIAAKLEGKKYDKNEQKQLRKAARKDRKRQKAATKRALRKAGLPDSSKKKRRAERLLKEQDLLKNAPPETQNGKNKRARKKDMKRARAAKRLANNNPRTPNAKRQKTNNPNLPRTQSV